MNRPVCNVDLLMSERLTVQIDYCTKCRGIWPGNGKQDKLPERSGSSTDRKGKERRRNDDDDCGIRGFLGGLLD